MEGGFADVEEGVNEGSLAGMTIAKDDQGSIVEFVFRFGLVEEFVPHGECLGLISEIFIN